MLRLRFQTRCGLGLNQKLPFVDGPYLTRINRKQKIAGTKFKILMPDEREQRPPDLVVDETAENGAGKSEAIDFKNFSGKRRIGSPEMAMGFTSEFNSQAFDSNP